jgi:hypothetical protein
MNHLILLLEEFLDRPAISFRIIIEMGVGNPRRKFEHNWKRCSKALPSTRLFSIVDLGSLHAPIFLLVTMLVWGCPSFSMVATLNGSQSHNYRSRLAFQNPDSSKLDSKIRLLTCTKKILRQNNRVIIMFDGEERRDNKDASTLL